MLHAAKFTSIWHLKTVKSSLEVSLRSSEFQMEEI